MIDSTIVIKLNEISKKYKLFDDKKARMKEALHPLKKQYHKDFYALNNINLEVRKGEILGIVGMNGSGKSTLLKIISGIIQPSEGTISVSGHVVPLLELGSGFNPEFTGLENIYFYNSIHGYSRKQTDAILDSILDFAEIGSFVHQPLKTYSSGMKARLAFAVSVNIDPDILILDEVLSVGDELFRRKCYAKMEEFFKAGKTVLFVSHAVQSINQLCTRTILLNNGELILEGPTKLVTAQYQRYIYAKKENQNAVRQDIVLMNQDELLKNAIYQEIEKAKYEETSEVIPSIETPKAFITEAAKQANEIVKPKAYYISNMVPKSRVEYRNFNVDIFDIMITTLTGENVNCIYFNENYLFKLKIKSNEEKLFNLALGFEIKNEQGQKISSIESSGLNKCNFIINEMKKNEIIEAVYFFRCLLNPGNYFTSHGISSFTNSQQVVLNRIVDAFTFKVISKELMYAGGFFPIVSRMEFTKGNNKYFLDTDIKDIFRKD